MRHSVREAPRNGCTMAAQGRPTKLLGQVMLAKGLITPRQLSDALKAQSRTKERLGRVLVDLGYVSELEMFRAVSDQDGLPFPSRFLAYFHRERGQRGERDAFARGRTRMSP